jgi:hypothetical protein
MALRVRSREGAKLAKAVSELSLGAARQKLFNKARRGVSVVVDNAALVQGAESREQTPRIVVTTSITKSGIRGHMSDLRTSYVLRSIFWPSKEKGLSVFLPVNHQNTTIRVEIAEQTSGVLLGLIGVGRSL